MIIAFIAFTVFSVHFCECWLKSGFFGTRRVSGRMQWRLQCSRTFSGRFIIVFSPFVSQPILLFYFNQFCVLSGHIDMEWYKKEAFSIENIRITLSWNKRILQIHRMRCWKINKIIWPCKCFNALQNSFVSLHWRMVRQRIETYFAYFFRCSLYAWLYQQVFGTQTHVCILEMCKYLLSFVVCTISMTFCLNLFCPVDIKNVQMKRLKNIIQIEAKKNTESSFEKVLSLGHRIKKRMCCVKITAGFSMWGG